MRLELTRRGDYAIRAMVALGASGGTTRLSVRRIASSMAIPVSFLPQVMRDLVAAGLVEPTTGRTGGYRLSRSLEEITVLEIIESVEGDGRRISCVLRGSPCGRDGHCAAHEVFFAAQDAMIGRLRGSSLADLVARTDRSD
jgi:Rrf2 family iron-sulfur cluster assembly transcriptional regulator